MSAQLPSSLVLTSKVRPFPLFVAAVFLPAKSDTHVESLMLVLCAFFVSSAISLQEKEETPLVEPVKEEEEDCTRHVRKSFRNCSFSKVLTTFVRTPSNWVVQNHSSPCQAMVTKWIAD